MSNAYPASRAGVNHEINRETVCFVKMEYTISWDNNLGSVRIQARSGLQHDLSVCQLRGLKLFEKVVQFRHADIQYTIKLFFFSFNHLATRAAESTNSGYAPLHQVTDGVDHLEEEWLLLAK